MDLSNGFYKLFWVHGKQRQISYKTFTNYDDAFLAYQKNTNSRVLTAGFDIKFQRTHSKKAKNDLSRMKNYINKMKMSEHDNERGIVASPEAASEEKVQAAQLSENGAKIEEEKKAEEPEN